MLPSKENKSNKHDLHLEQTFSCSKSTIGTLEKDKKYVTVIETRYSNRYSNRN